MAPHKRLFLGLLLLLALAVLAWAGWRIGDPQGAAEITARPALWRISQGDREAYLFGTIHAVPKGAKWISPAIAKAIARSDVLILEVAGLDSERSSHAVFERLGRSNGLPEIGARLDQADAEHFRAFARDHADELRGLPRYESWAAALLINAAASSDLALTADDAGEAVLSGLFGRDHKPVEGLETIEGQLGLFDTLPEADQRILLAQSVREADDAPRLYRDLYNAWSKGDVHRLEAQFVAPLADAPALRRVLVDERNRRWSEAIDHRLRTNPGVPFVAVGAGHLLGPASLQERLSKLGWHVERLQ